MNRARVSLALMRFASLAALVGAVALLVADSPGPQCAEYEAVDVIYTFENTCTPETTTGEVHFVLTAEQAESGEHSVLVGQAAAGGLSIAQPSVVYSLAGCGADEAGCGYGGDTGGTAEALGIGFDAFSGPTPTTPETFVCDPSSNGIHVAQRLTCTNVVAEAEKQTCTVTLTPKA